MVVQLVRLIYTEIRVAVVGQQYDEQVVPLGRLPYLVDEIAQTLVQIVERIGNFLAQPMRGNVPRLVAGKCGIAYQPVGAIGLGAVIWS